MAHDWAKQIGWVRGKAKGYTRTRTRTILSTITSLSSSLLGLRIAGASWHVDPFLTSAWNSLIVGEKRWALYPPGRIPPGLKVDIDGEDEDEDGGSGEPQVLSEITSLQWYLEVYPHLRPEDKPMEITQRPGETIFIPSGWWHCVLNLQQSVAVTQVSRSRRFPDLFHPSFC